MFHVKHSQRPADLDLKAIGRDVREILESSLGDLGLATPELASRLERYAATLALWADKTNLTAHPEDPAEIAYHIVDSLMPLAMARSGAAPTLERSFAAGKRILDIGSGAGFPGLILAAATRCALVLTEPRRKRASFLEEAAVAMRLENVTVAACRAIELDSPDLFDVVTSRGVKIDHHLFSAAARLLKPSGLLLCFIQKTQEVDSESSGKSGLSAPVIAPYELRHGTTAVTHALAIWTRARI